MISINCFKLSFFRSFQASCLWLQHFRQSHHHLVSLIKTIFMTTRSIFRLQLQLHNSMTPLAGCNVINVPGYNATTFECDNSAPTAIKTRPIPTRQLHRPLLALWAKVDAKVIVQKKTRAEGLSAICNKPDGQTSWNRLVLYQLGDDEREREDGDAPRLQLAEI